MGSFVNVLINRLPLGQPIGFERSKCPHCQKKLAWWELIPLFSFLFLRGRCSKCNTKISWQYPLVEFITGFSFTLVFYKFISVSGLRITSYSMRLEIFDFASRIFTLNPCGLGNAEELATKCGLPIFNLLFWFVVVGLLIAIFVVDLKELIVPNELVYFGMFWGLGGLFLDKFTSWSILSLVKSSNLASLSWLPSSFINLSFSSFTTHFFFAIIGAGFFLFLIVLTRGKGMGVGDLKLVFFLGLIFGVYLLDIIYLAFLLGGFVGVLLLALKKKGLKSKVPFGPFLAFVALLFILI